MVIRLWSYRVPAAKAVQFEEFERQYGLPMVQSHSGCLGVEFFRQIGLAGEETNDNQEVEYSMISRWESQGQLEMALASAVWQGEVALFQAQSFNDQHPGSIRHFELI